MAFFLQDDMDDEQFGTTYRNYQDQLDGISKALSYLGARELSGTNSEQGDILRLEAELNRKRGQIDRQFDLFLSSSVAVTPPLATDSAKIENLLNDVAKLTSKQKLADATLVLVNDLADTVAPLLQK